RQSRTVVVYLDEDKPEVAVNLLSAIRSHLGAVKVRGLGSAALELCYTALGRFAVFADLRERLRNVDVAAALGFLREAGGEAYTLKGEPLDSPLDRVVSLSGVIASLDLDLARRLGGVVTRVGMR
ncbi:MAG: inositol monophosphatase family protein, partial [Acidilobaceae archaeon]